MLKNINTFIKKAWFGQEDFERLERLRLQKVAKVLEAKRLERLEAERLEKREADAKKEREKTYLAKLTDKIGNHNFKYGYKLLTRLENSKYNHSRTTQRCGLKNYERYTDENQRIYGHDQTNDMMYRNPFGGRPHAPIESEKIHLVIKLDSERILPDSKISVDDKEIILSDCVLALTIRENYGQIKVECDDIFLDHNSKHRGGVMKFKKAITIYRDYDIQELETYIEYFLTPIKNYLKSKLHLEIKSEKAKRIRESKFEEFKEKIDECTIFEYFAYVNDCFDDVKIDGSKSYSLEPYIMTLKYNSNVDRLNMEDLSINEKNSNLLFELSDSVYRFNQNFSYICNLNLQFLEKKIVLKFKLKN